VAFSHPEHYTKVAARIAQERGGFWANQFDNVANRQAHEDTTGPEIWQQTGGKIDGFICAVGSGGTLGGVSRALKARNSAITIGIADPMGAALYSWYAHGQLASSGTSITEGIGQGRVTANLEDVVVDWACQVEDPEWLPVLFDLVAHEGLAVGGSAALNVAGAIKLARQMGPGHTIVTVLCDYASRYQSKLFNPEFLASKGLPVPPWMA
jgi:cysteine synthase